MKTFDLREMEIVVTAQNSGQSARVTGATEALKIDSNRKMKAPNYNKISIMAAGLGLAFFVMPDAQAQTATQRGKKTAPKKTSASNNSSTRQAVRGSRPATGGTSGSTSRPVDPQSGQRDPNAGRPGGASYPNSGQTGSPTSGPSIQGQGGPKQSTTQPTSGPSIQGQGGPAQTKDPFSGGGSPSIEGKQPR